MIDSHTHLDRGPAPEAELVAQARAAGVTRILTIGMDGPSCRAALAAAEAHEEVYAAIGRHPNEATGYDDAVTAELRELAEAAARVPADRLLVETDAPYLTPQVVRKERNRPEYVVHTARFIAERRGIGYAELEAAVEANAARLFGW